jgi:hypothetical protein
MNSGDSGSKSGSVFPVWTCPFMMTSIGEAPAVGCVGLLKDRKGAAVRNFETRYTIVSSCILT